MAVADSIIIGIRSLAEIVAAYANDPPVGDGRRKRLRRFLRVFAVQSSLDGAIEKAFSVNHPHQHCLAKKKLAQVQTKLKTRSAQIAEVTDFETLHKIVTACVRPPFKHADLLIYDLSIRIGAKLQLEPSRIYLHCGALEGAGYVLGRSHLPNHVPHSDLPAEFQALRPVEAEDCLCIYKADLKKLHAARVLP